MRLAIVGSRDFTNYNVLYHALCELIDERVDLIISGGARGTDSLAEVFAKEWDIPTKIFIPEWGRFGRAAGMIRNKYIVEEADYVVAFWNGFSKGTADSINYAKTLGTRHTVVLI